MSEVSEEMLTSRHPRVHEQFDMLVAAMHTQTALQTDLIFSEVDGKSAKEIEKWVRSAVSRQMIYMGYKVGFMKKRFLAYVFQLYELFYREYMSVLPFKEGTPLTEVQHSILMLAAAYLDNQFRTKGRSDVCGFLKTDMRTVLSFGG